MRLGFLFGAGVSLSCGALPTSGLTKAILWGENVHRHTNGTYYLCADGSSCGSDHQTPEQIRAFLRFLDSQANDFFQKNKERHRVANYEDLYYLATQLTDGVDEYENPALAGFLASAQARCTSENLFDQTRRYIKGIVSERLRNLAPQQDHLAQVVHAAADTSFSKIEIFTLNHDCLLRKYLSGQKFPSQQDSNRMPRVYAVGTGWSSPKAA
ncbi:MAG TPA: hypothetical protein VGR96_02245, partial [Acidobacteriaceae bacterium]|nr:hypothetical protein [Acidobacteriaceae bacterium]